jgi:D-alanine-D-alanine ligase
MTDLNESLLRLDPATKRELRVIFLARQAPLELHGPRPELHERFGVEPRYNYEIMSILQQMDIDCVPCRSLDDFDQLVQDANFVFTIFNRAGFRNGEIYVSLQCEKLGVPYLGAPPNLRALAEDKSFAKHLACSIGLKTVPWKTYGLHERLDPPPFAGPYFVKPRFGAASEGISVESIQNDWHGLKAQIENLLDQRKDAIVEQCINGTDVTVPVLGGEQSIILDVIEEVSDLPSGICTYRQKRLLDKGRVRRTLGNPELAQKISADVERFCAHVRPFDYLRVDFHLCKKTQNAYFLEFNIGCNLGSHAAIMFAATNRGIEQKRIIEHILAYSLLRQGKIVVQPSQQLSVQI